MKIRTITTGISLQSATDEASITQAAEFNQQAKAFFEQQGYEVQTTRISTNSWAEYLPALSPTEIIRKIQAIEQVCQNLDISFFSIGCVSNPEEIAVIPEIIKNTLVIYCSSHIGDVAAGINFENAKASAKVIKRISEETEDGFGNFRFCAGANCRAGIPFFPIAYHEGSPSFAIGLECGDLVMAAFSDSQNLQEAEANFKQILEEKLSEVEILAKQISAQYKIEYRGIDSSLAPSLDKSASIACSYEALSLGKFGHQGTLAISAMITRVLKNLSVKLCGYSGLMLPVCEDAGLAQRASEGTYNLTNLLLYSAVCGCGLDTVPLPGNIPVETLETILIDMAALAIKLDKPLSARLFPIAGKKEGEMTAFNSPYLVDCKIFNVE